MRSAEPREGGHAIDGAYENWAFLQPNDYLTQDCAVMQRSDGKWGDENCGLSRRYICQSFVDQCPSDPTKTAPAQCGCGVPDTDSDGDGTADCNDACPSDPLRTEPDCTPDNDCFLVASGGSQYYICGTRRSYASAKAQCESIGWNLVRVDSASEANFLAFYLWDDAWAGANDLANEGQWRWDIGGDQFWNGGVFGSPVGGLYSSWFLGQPDNLLDQDCLQIEGNGQFSDDHCYESEEYICEDMCPNDTAKSLPGVCGCGVSEADSDDDGTPDCIDPDCSMPGCKKVGEGCTQDADCTALGSGAYCDLELPGGYCTVPCDGSAGSCPTGASCLGSDHCVLECEPDQTCPDADQVCAVLDPPGGAAFCRPTCALPCPAAAWCDDNDDRCVDCTSDDTTCDGVDDDCDGQIDDDYAPQSTSCGTGACTSTGSTSCTGGTEQDSCTPGAPAADDATCDDVDDDCDGVKDEDFASQPTSCGTGACASTGATSCTGGIPGDSCTPGTPAPSDATCDGVDDDCDSTSDEDFAGTPTNCGGSGACAASGTTTCTGGVPGDSCTPVPNCEYQCGDGTDNDGDGQSDCADADCATASVCGEAPDCSDGLDNDQDGFLDCADPDCTGVPPCYPEICGNSLDDDGDQLFDCADPDCDGDAVCATLPPDPTTIAPPLSTEQSAGVLESTSFLFEGGDPIQRGVAPGTIEARRASLVRGKVMATNGSPIEGVRVSIANHPEFGYTRTRSDGMFDLVVNGGGSLVVDYELTGHAPVQRRVPLQWQQYVFAPDVVMTPVSATTTTVDVANPVGMQVAVGDVISDGDGTRQAVLAFPDNVGATMRMADGSTAPLSSMTLRVTEFTTGPTGLQAMPAQLPAGTAYTYAVDITVDEAEATGATTVELSEPVPYYLDNFLDFPVGVVVPAGYYDPAIGTWKATPNGLVVAIISITAGLADLDLDGDGIADDQAMLDDVGISADERTMLATRYPIGKTLWRVPLEHFTPVDFNPIENVASNYTGPPGPGDDGGGGGGGGGGPGGGSGAGAGGSGPGDGPDCGAPGSLIKCFSQGLIETIPLHGTPYSLTYDSREATTAGVQSKHTAILSDDTLPSAVGRIFAEFTLAGQRTELEWSPQPNLQYTFDFDANTANFGRPIVGSTDLDVRICYEYAVSWGLVKRESLLATTGSTPPLFGAYLGTAYPSPVRYGHGPRAGGLLPFVACRDYTRTLAATSRNGIGHWQIDEHHFYDPVTHTLHEGTGFIRKAAARGLVAETLYGVSQTDATSTTDAKSASLRVSAMATSGDGSLAMITDPYGTMRSVDADGKLQALGYFDEFSNPDLDPDYLATADLAVGCENEIYAQEIYLSSVFDPYGGLEGRIVRYDRHSDGTLIFPGTVVAGGGTSLEDGVLATDAGIPAPALARGPREQSPSYLDQATYQGIWHSLEVGPDCSLYFLESGIHTLYTINTQGTRVRRVSPDGRISDVIGSRATSQNSYNDYEYDGDVFPRLFAVGPDSSIYADLVSPNDYSGSNRKTVRVHPDGTMETLFTYADYCPSPIPPEYGCDPAATSCSRRCTISSMTVSPSDGNLYFGLRIEKQEGPTTFTLGKVMFLNSDGALSEVAGDEQFHGIYDPSLDGYHAGPSQLFDVVDLEFGPDGYLYLWNLQENLFVTNSRATVIRRIQPPLPGSALFAGGLLVPSGDSSEVFVFSSGGQHRETRDALTGNVIRSFGYGADGQLASITDGSNNTTTIVRNGASVVITGPYGQQTTLGLDTEDRLTSVAGPDGSTWGMTYAGSTARLASLTNPRQHTSSFTYDAEGRLIRDDDAANGYTELARSESGATTTVTKTLATNEVTTYEHTPGTNGAFTRTVTFADQTSNTLTVASNGDSDTVYASGDQVIVRTIDNPRWGMTRPDHEQTWTTPEGLQRITVTSEEVVLSDFSNPLSLVQSTTTSTINGRDHVSVFDAATLTTTTTTPEQRQRTVTIDSLGRPVQVASIGLHPTLFTYDAHGRLETVTRGTGPDARTVTHGYFEGASNPDQEGYLQSISGPLANYVTSFEPDAAGRTLSTTRPDGVDIAMSYDPIGNLQSVTPPGQPAHALSYTPIDQLDTYTAPAEAPSNQPAVQDIDYTLDRKVDLVTLADGRTIDYQYDPTNGKLAHVVTPEAVYDYVYDPQSGQLATLTSTDALGVHVLAHTYDGQLLRTVTWGGDAGLTSGSVESVYDNDFRLDRLLADGVEVVDYAYDGDGLIVGAGAMTLGRDPGNGLLTGTLVDQVSTVETTTAFGELDNRTGTCGTTLCYENDIVTRDKLGRITEHVETDDDGSGPSTTTYDYQYDLAGRLERVFENSVQTAQYIYDDNGNRLARVTAAGTVVGRYDARDRLTSYCPEDGLGNPLPTVGLPCFSYSYRESGELLTKTDVASGIPTTYDYDVRGGLRSVALPDGRVVDYELDAQGRRVGKYIDGVRTQGFLYKDALNPVAELDGAGNVVATFAYATMSHVPDLMTTSGATYRIVTDQLGSVRLVVDVATGVVAQRLDYDEFGRVLVDTNPGFQPFGFAGGLYDVDTGLVRFGARDYDAVTGRWTAKDPILFEGGQENLYVYVNGDPVNGNDRTGLAADTAEQDFELCFANCLEYDPDPNDYAKNICSLVGAGGAILGGLGGEAVGAAAALGGALVTYAQIAICLASCGYDEQQEFMRDARCRHDPYSGLNPNDHCELGGY